MKLTTIATALLGVALFGIPGLGYADEKSDLGMREYLGNCAVCHGKSGKGDGPYAGLIDTRIADLTTLAKRNNGVFPFARVFQTIDGTQLPKAHGTPDMPIWGNAYRLKAAEYYRDVDYDPAIFVRARILALTEYVYRLQAK